jgi:hypothetical protein
MIDKFAALIPQSLLKHSGAVFYSGRKAFSTPSSLYILGLNPGGSPEEQAADTVERHTEKVLNEAADDWSAYRDEIWRGNSPGTSGMQPRVRYLLRQLNLEPGNVPASNVIFMGSARGKDIDNRFRQLAELCWPFHQAVIERLGVRVVLCFGQKSGDWVRERLNANNPVDQFVEQYEKRHWTSISYKNSDGVAVVVATHPSWADWTNSQADPSQLVKRMLEVTT